MDLGIGGLGYATKIGAGASAIVYRARQLDLDREVAVKVLTVTDEAFIRRFDREAKTLGKLSQNPGIVTVYDTGVSAAGEPYLILELCESSVLDTLQGPQGRFEPLAACRAAAQVADAVGDAHAKGVIHRDIKPGNVLISPTGRYMVTDFGISTVTGTTLGQTNSVGFTVGYVAPEILTDQSAGTASDVYAVGATLFHMVAGRAPFVDPADQSNLMALAKRVMNDPVPDLRGEGVPDALCGVIEAAMAKRPEDRPTADELRDLLLEVLGPDAVQTGDLPATAPPAAATSAPGPTAGNGAAAPGVGPQNHDAAIPGLAAAAGLAGSMAVATTTSQEPAMAPTDSTVAASTVAGHMSASGTPVGQAAAEDPSSATSLWEGSSAPSGRVLEDGPSIYPPSGGTGPPRPALVHIEDERSMTVPLLLGAAVGLLLLVGVGGYLVSRSGGDDGDGGLNIESVEGPTTSVDRSGNESTGQGVAGGRGTLEPAITTTTDDEIATTETTAETGTTATDPVSEVVIPPLAGRTRGEAERALAGLELLVAADAGRVFHPSLPSGAVISSIPAAGSTIEVGTTVSLLLSDGPAPPRCSDVIGLTEAQATATLAGGGFAVSSAPRSSDTVGVGNVISCDQSESSASLAISSGADVCGQAIGIDRASAASLLESRGYSVSETGTPNGEVEAGEVVTCRLSGSTATIEYATTPLPDECSSVEGRSESQARTILADLGFTDVGVTSATSESVPEGEVISCSVSRSTATLVVSTGPADVIVPDVAGLRRGAANRELRDAGLEPGDVEEVPSPQPKGQIVATRPAVGSAVRPGTEVVLIVSNGQERTVEVPGVVGLTRPTATMVVNAAGLSPNFDTEQFAPGNDKIGTVVAIDPDPGTEVPVGSTVTLTVGVPRQDN